MSLINALPQGDGVFSFIKIAAKLDGIYRVCGTAHRLEVWFYIGKAMGAGRHLGKAVGPP